MKNTFLRLCYTPIRLVLRYIDRRIGMDSPAITKALVDILDPAIVRCTPAPWCGEDDVDVTVVMADGRQFRCVVPGDATEREVFESACTHYARLLIK